MNESKQARTVRRGSHGNGYVTSRNLSPRFVPISSCKPLGRATQKHSPKQLRKLAASLNRFGFVLPILINAEARVVAGWGVVLAAKQLGLTEVPAVTITDLSEAKTRALRLALNRIALDAEWNEAELAIEFSEILELEPQLELEITAFETPEIDGLLERDGREEEDELPPPDPAVVPVTRPGDLWDLDDHRMFCGDALGGGSYDRLMGTEKAQMVFADGPYNVPIEGHASGLGAVRHGDFAMASGELSPAEYTAFLKTAFGHAAARSIDGAINFQCGDWRHLREVLAAAEGIYDLKNLCIWRKSNPGMGSLYRSGHELVFVFKVGRGPHINNIELGRHGRNRSNVWDYVSQNALNGTAKSKLRLHPTVKPVALVADAIRDCSNRGGVILDPFGGAGTTLIAAERTSRRARLIEINPTFVDVSIERWQRLTGGTARHAETGQPFARPGGSGDPTDPAPQVAAPALHRHGRRRHG
jgi:DNA modification methylase